MKFDRDIMHKHSITYLKMARSEHRMYEIQNLIIFDKLYIYRRIVLFLLCMIIIEEKNI
jgi:hypothetical protein